MLQFYKTTDESGLDVAINPTYIAQIESYTGSDSLSFIVMDNGKRYLVKENCAELTEKLTMLANHIGVR